MAVNWALIQILMSIRGEWRGENVGRKSRGKYCNSLYVSKLNHRVFYYILRPNHCCGSGMFIPDSNPDQKTTPPGYFEKIKQKTCRRQDPRFGIQDPQKIIPG
jgi:hypothetical protein